MRDVAAVIKKDLPWRSSSACLSCAREGSSNDRIWTKGVVWADDFPAVVWRFASSTKIKAHLCAVGRAQSHAQADAKCSGLLCDSIRRTHGGSALRACIGNLSNKHYVELFDETLMAVDLVDQQGVHLSRDMIYCLLQECTKKKDLGAARQVYSLMVSSRLDTVPSLVDHLIRLFASCDSLIEANQIFCTVVKPTVYTWNAIISAHAKLGSSETALKLFHEMQHIGLKPDKITFLCILKACGSIGAIREGRHIHYQISQSSLLLDMIVGSALIDMYAKCGSVEDARKLFDDLPNRDVVSWGSMISGYAQHGDGISAMELFEKMLYEGIALNKIILLCILKACGSVGAIEHGRLIHYQVIRSQLDSDPAVGSSLVDMYAKSRSLDEAHKVFEHLPYRDSAIWGAMIGGYAQLGHDLLTLDLFEKMHLEGILPSTPMFLCVLKSCGNVGVLRPGMMIHEQLIKSGLETDVVLGNTIIDMYAKCGSLREARKVFEQLLSRDVMSWGALMTGYSLHGRGPSVLELFEKMQLTDIVPDKVVFLCLLQACSSMGDIVQGRMVHEQIDKFGLQSHLVLGNTLVDMYAKCGSLEDACNVFDKLESRDDASWGAMISGYVQHGHALVALELLTQMQEEGIKAGKVTFLSTLKACSSVGFIQQGRLLHDQIIESGMISDWDIGSTLVDMYVKSGNVEEARKVFDELPSRDVVSWSTMISGYVQVGQDFPALKLIEKMQLEGLNPSKAIFLCILKACGNMGHIAQGRLIHDQIIRNELQMDVSVGNALIRMYVKCQNLKDAWGVFNDLPIRDDMSWGIMIAGYIENGDGLVSLDLLAKSQQQDFIPGASMFVCVLKACGSIGAIEEGRWVHNELLRSGFELDLVIGSALVDMYVKCGSLDEACEVFDALPTRDLVSCGCMIAGYVQYEQSLHAVDLFKTMQQDGMKSDRFTYFCVLQACGSIGAVGQGRLVHIEIIRSGLEADAVIRSTLVDMYTKCGSSEEACKVFDQTLDCDALSWGTIIAGHARHGNFKLAWQTLQGMQRQGLRPTKKMFSSILAACSHAGLLNEGHHCFKSMIEDHSIAPTVEHCNCMIDLLGRAGRLDEAKYFLETMPIFPDIVSWRSLLTGCRTYGNIVLGRHCFDEVVRLKPNDASGYILMSNLYAEAQMWGDVEKIQAQRKSAGAPKKAGRAWVEVSNIVHEFIVGGKSHPGSDDIYRKLDKLSTQIKKQGFLPQLDICLEPFFYEDEDTLCEYMTGHYMTRGLVS